MAEKTVLASIFPHLLSKDSRKDSTVVGVETPNSTSNSFLNKAILETPNSTPTLQTPRPGAGLIILETPNNKALGGTRPRSRIAVLETPSPTNSQIYSENDAEEGMEVGGEESESSNEKDSSDKSESNVGELDDSTDENENNKKKNKDDEEVSKTVLKEKVTVTITPSKKVAIDEITLDDTPPSLRRSSRNKTKLKYILDDSMPEKGENVIRETQRAALVEKVTSKRFKCKKCAYTSTRAFNVKKHAEGHLSPREYKCNLCPSVVKNEAYFKGHMKTKHNIKINL